MPYFVFVFVTCVCPSLPFFRDVALALDGEEEGQVVNADERAPSQPLLRVGLLRSLLL